MKSKLQLYFFLCLLYSCSLLAQSEGLTVKLNKEGIDRSQMWMDGNTLTLYKYNKNKLSEYGIDLIFPYLKGVVDTAVIFLPVNINIHSMDNNQSVKDYRIALVCNYTLSNTILYIDQNNSYNLKNRKPVKLKLNSKKRITLDATYNSSVQYSIYKPKEKSWPAKIFTNNFTAVDEKYSISYEKHNIRYGVFKVQDINYSLAIVDFNLNGKYNENGNDILMLAKNSDKMFDVHPGISVRKVSDRNVVKCGSVFFEVLEIDPVGNYVKLHKSNPSPDPLRVLDSLPNLEITLINNQNVHFKDYLANEKMLYVQIESLYNLQSLVFPEQQMNKLYGENLSHINFISLYEGFGMDLEALRVNIKANHVKWDQGYLTPEIADEFMIDRYPVGYLFDKNGKLVKKINSYTDLEMLLRKTK